MALSGNELVEIHKPDAKGNPASRSVSVKLSQLASLPAGTTIDVTPGLTNGNQIANTRAVKTSAFGSLGANDTVDVRTPVGTGVSSRRQTVLASAVAAFIS